MYYYIFYVFWIHTIALDKKPTLLFTENIHVPFSELLTEFENQISCEPDHYQQIHRKIWFCSWIATFLMDLPVTAVLM